MKKPLRANIEKAIDDVIVALKNSGNERLSDLLDNYRDDDAKTATHLQYVISEGDLEMLIKAEKVIELLLKNSRR
jgi:hypothetical protein